MQILGGNELRFGFSTPKINLANIFKGVFNNRKNAGLCCQ
jgi:hypothetical protein